MEKSIFTGLLPEAAGVDMTPVLTVAGAVPTTGASRMSILPVHEEAMLTEEAEVMM